MTRTRYVDVYIPVGSDDVGYGGIGVVGSMAALLGSVIGFAVLVCLYVSCADFGDGGQLPESSCEPFCPSTSAVPVEGVAR